MRGATSDSGEFKDISFWIILGDASVWSVNSSGRLLNQVALGLPVDGTLVNCLTLGDPGLDVSLDSVRLLCVDADSSCVVSSVLSGSDCFPLSSVVGGAVCSPVSGLITVEGPGCAFFGCSLGLSRSGHLSW